MDEEQSASKMPQAVLIRLSWQVAFLAIHRIAWQPYQVRHPLNGLFPDGVKGNLESLGIQSFEKEEVIVKEVPYW